MANNPLFLADRVVARFHHSHLLVSFFFISFVTSSFSYSILGALITVSYSSVRPIFIYSFPPPYTAIVAPNLFKVI